MTEPLRRMGFFHEIQGGLADGGSLRDSLRPEPSDHEGEVAAYLARGSVLGTTSKLAPDVLSDDPSPIATLETRTDGTWLWPSDLAYYVRTYHLALPEEFLEHAASRAWKSPALSLDELGEITERLWS